MFVRRGGLFISLYKSKAVIVPRALSSEAVEDMAADNITAKSSPIKPLGRLCSIKWIKT